MRLNTGNAQRRVRHLTESDVLRICTLVATWPLPTITWDALTHEVKLRLGVLWSRQALQKHPSIRSAFQQKKRSPVRQRMKDLELAALQRLRNRIQELEATLGRYEERFACHIFNARRGGLSLQDLEAPLPRVGRGQSDGCR